jgi:hypothetical protein
VVKTKTEVLAMWRKYADIGDDLRDFLMGFSNAADDIDMEISVGNPSEDVREKQKNELRQLKLAANDFWMSMRRFQRTIHHTLGEYAGVPNPLGRYEQNISSFNDKLVEDSENIAERGISKGGWIPNVNNAGDGTVIELTISPDGSELDCGHNENTTLRCIRVNAQGVAEFSLTGGKRTFFRFNEESGAGNAGGGYLYEWGQGDNDFPSQVPLLTADIGSILSAYYGSSGRNMIQNGGFEDDEGSAELKIAGAEIVDGDPANVGLVTSGQIKGNKSLSISGNVTIAWPINGAVAGMPMFVTMLGLKTDVAFAGDFVLRVVSDNGVHHFTEFDWDDLGTDPTDPFRSTLVFNLDHNIGDNLRIELQSSDVGGSGMAIFDELVVGALSLYDSSRAIAVIQGAEDFTFGDNFEASTTISTTGSFQRMINELFGRHLIHDVTATFWSES